MIRHGPHQTLLQRMCSLDLPDHLYNWVVNYFNNRSHITSHQGALSRLVVINASVIQGSVMGPPSYIVQASDLHPVRVFNALMKYADDSYLLVGSNNLFTAIFLLQRRNLITSRTRLERII